MTDETKAGEHFTARSGDTHVIGTPDGVEDHAVAVNVDQLARDAAVPAAAAEPIVQTPVEQPKAKQREPEQPDAGAEHADT